VFLFVGLEGDAKSLDLPRRNLWVLPHDDLDKAMAEFHKAPTEAPFGYVGIAFPSAKDPTFAERHPGKSTAALIAGDVPWSVFAEWEHTKVHHRGTEYEDLKALFQERMLAELFRHYPQVKDKVVHVSSGTPLDTNFYLGKTQGESYGLQLSPAKTQAELQWLGPVPNVEGFPKGLVLAGQDLGSDGFAPAVTSAMMAAVPIEGFLHWLSVVDMLGGWRSFAKALCTEPPAVGLQTAA
jgi:phytoene dehydrogenase-like protein